MKKFNWLLVAAALLFSAQFAKADEIKAPLWTCNLSFNVRGGGVRVIVGSFALRGPGEITCADTDGNVQVLPVLVTLGAQPISLSVGVGVMHLVGIASGIGVAGQPSDLLGSYVVGSVRGAFAAGAGVDVALHGTQNTLTLNAAVQAIGGVGFNAGFDVMTVEAL